MLVEIWIDPYLRMVICFLCVCVKGHSDYMIRTKNILQNVT